MAKTKTIEAVNNEDIASTTDASEDYEKSYDWESEGGISKLMKGYEHATAYARPLWQRRINNFNTLIGKIRQKKYESKANFHVPYAQTLQEIVFSLLVANEPRGVVQPRLDDKDRDAADMMQQLSTYALDANLFDKMFPMAVKESMQFDTAWVRTSWDYKNKETDRPNLELLDTFHVLVHPRKTRLDDRWPVYYYLEMTKEEMRERGWNEARIASLSNSKMKDDEWRRKRLQSLGYLNSMPYDDDVELYPVVEVFFKTDLGDKEKGEEQAYIVIGNENTILNPDIIPGRKKFQSPYDHQFCPLVPLPYDPQPHLIYGTSFIDPIASQQLELNALENMKAENYLMRNNPPLLVVRGADVDLASLKFLPGMPWVVDEPGGAELMLIPDLAESIDNQQQMIRQVMQDRTGANDVLLVSDVTPIKGGESATGASIANENTKMRFQPQGMQIDFFNERIVQIIVSMYQQDSLFDRPIDIGITDKPTSKMVIKKINPKDVQGDIQYKITSLSSLPDSPSMEMQKAILLKQTFQNNPDISQTEIDKKIMDAAGWDWNQMTMDKDLLAAQQAQQIAAHVTALANKLDQMVAITQHPGFNPQDPKNQNLLANIIQIRTQIQQMLSQPQAQTPQQPGDAIGTNNLQPTPSESPQAPGQPPEPAGAVPMPVPKPSINIR